MKKAGTNGFRSWARQLSILLAITLMMGPFSTLAAYAEGGSASNRTPFMAEAPTEAGNPDQFDLLRQRWLDFTIGDDSWDETAPDYQLKLKSLSNEAEALIALMVTDREARSRVFSDYPLGNKGSWYDSDNLTKTYKRLQSIATAYATRGTTLYQDEATRDLIVGSMDYVYTYHYNENMTPYGNWFTWSIGSPMALMATTMIMWDDLTPTQRANYAKPSLKWPDHGDVSRSDRGTNGIWRRKCDLYAGIVTKDAALLKDVQTLYPQFLHFVTSGQGFYADGTHIYHSNHMYNGGYGLGHFRDVVEILYYLNGSEWDVSSNDLSNVYTIAYDAYIPLLPKGMMMSLSQGREITRTGGDLKVGQSAMATLMRLADSSKEEEDRQYINGYLKEWMSNDKVNEYFNANGTISEIAMKNKVMNSDDYQAVGNVQKYHQYTVGDKAVAHSEHGYSAGLGMHSRRIYNFEVGDSNRKGWNINNGRLYLYTDDINQHEDAVKATIDWDRLAGTTVVRGTGNTSAGHGRVGAFAGGVGMDGLYGVSSMFLRDKYNTLDAKKSYFFFDDEIVELGSGITASDGKPTETILENIKLGGDPSQPEEPGAGDNRFVVDGQEVSNQIGTAQSFTNPGYLWVEGNTDGSDFGAYFPADATISTLRETRSGKMSDLGTSNAGMNTVMQRNYLTLYQDHGNNPVKDKYSFVLLPNRPQEAVAAYSASPDVEILAHEENLHAVFEKNLNLVAVSSFAAQKQSVNAHGVDAYISVDKPANIMSRESGSTLSLVVSDPLQTATGKINVVINRKAYQVLSKDDRVDVIKTEPYIELAINTSGSKGKPIAIELSMDISDLPPPPTEAPAQPVLQYEVDNNGISVFFDTVGADAYTLKYGRKMEGITPTELTETVEMGGTTLAYIANLIDDATYVFQVTATNAIGSTDSELLEVAFADDTKDYFEFVDDYEKLNLSKIYKKSPETGWSWGDRSDIGGDWCLVRPTTSKVSELIYAVPGMSGFDLNAYQSGEGGDKYAAITFYTAKTSEEVESNNWTQIYPMNAVATDTGAKFYTDDYAINGLIDANYLKISIEAKGAAAWAPELEKLTVRYPKDVANAVEPTGINFVNSESGVSVGKTVDIPFSAIPSTVRPMQLSDIIWSIDDPAMAEVESAGIHSVTVRGLAAGDTQLIATLNDNEIARTPLAVTVYRPNLAQNKTATMSKKPTTGNVADAVDGDPETRFGFKTGIGNAPGRISFTVDMGEVYEITDFAILWEASRPKNYILEGSDTGADGSWQTITSRTATPPSKPDWERFALDAAVSTRYIRLSTDAYTGKYGYSIFEFQVFGNVPIPPIEGLAIEPDKLTLLEGETSSLSAVYTPSIADGSHLKWTTSNEAVATVDANSGRVAAVGPGNAVITVTDEDAGKSATCNVTVGSYSGDLPANATKIVLTPSDTVMLTPDSTLQLEAQVLPESAANKIITYSSSNTRIATVDKNGMVSAHSRGTATIVARNVASGVKAQLTVVVQKLDKTALSLAIAAAASLVEADYTSASWNALQAALEAATVVNDNPEATHAEVNHACEALQQAIEGLVRLDSQADKSALQLAIATAASLTKEEYTEASWTAMQTALERATLVNDKVDATQQEINDVLHALKTAIEALVWQEDTDPDAEEPANKPEATPGEPGPSNTVNAPETAAAIRETAQTLAQLDTLDALLKLPASEQKDKLPKGVQLTQTANGNTLAAVEVKMHSSSLVSFDTMQLLSDVGEQVGLKATIGFWNPVELVLPGGFQMPVGVYALPMTYHDTAPSLTQIEQLPALAGKKLDSFQLGVGALPTAATITFKTKLTEGGTVAISRYDPETGKLTKVADATVVGGRVAFATNVLGEFVLVAQS